MPDDQAKNLRDIASQLEEYVGELREVATMLSRKGTATGRLATAMTAPLRRPGVVFVKRLEEQVRAITVLSRYYMEHLPNDQQTLFFEAGSTPALLAMSLAEAGQGKVKTAVTNNKAVADVLCPWTKVWQTEGWAETKYYGVFPFAWSENDDLEGDEAAFQRLHRTLSARVDRLVLDASRFNFLVGPTVNSWQNLLYKAVAYNVRKPIDVLLPCSKIVTELGDPAEVNPKTPRETLHWHLANCHTVFGLPRFNEVGAKGVGLIIPAPDCEQKGAGITRFRDTAKNLGLKLTWLSLAESNSDLRVWVAARDENEKIRLTEHLTSLNRAIAALGYGLKWNVDKEEEREGVWLLVIRPVRPSEAASLHG